MTKTLAPSAKRYLGTKRIQSSSPAPMTKMARRRTTRLRLSPKKSARDFKARTNEFGPECRHYSSKLPESVYGRFLAPLRSNNNGRKKIGPRCKGTAGNAALLDH